MRAALFADLGWETSPAHMVFDRRGRLFVACDLTSSVIEVDAWGAVRRRYEIAPGEESAIDGLLATSTGSVWVASRMPDSLHRIDPKDKTVVAFQLDYGSKPCGLLESLGFVFCANTGYGTIAGIDRGGRLSEPFAVLPRASEPIALSADSQGRLYALDWQTGGISVTSPEGGPAVWIGGIPPDTLPFGITREYRGTLFVVSSEKVFRLDLQSGALEEVAELPASPFSPIGLADHPGGFSITGGTGVVLSVDARAPYRGRITEFAEELRLDACAYNARGDLFVADYSSGQIFRAEP